jgi:hypothetical protein
MKKFILFFLLATPSIIWSFPATKTQLEINGTGTNTAPPKGGNGSGITIIIQQNL